MEAFRVNRDSLYIMLDGREGMRCLDIEANKLSRISNHMQKLGCLTNIIVLHYIWGGGTSKFQAFLVIMALALSLQQTTSAEVGVTDSRELTPLS
jgi:hypothetical protein